MGWMWKGVEGATKSRVGSREERTAWLMSASYRSAAAVCICSFQSVTRRALARCTAGAAADGVGSMPTVGSTSTDARRRRSGLLTALIAPVLKLSLAAAAGPLAVASPDALLARSISRCDLRSVSMSGAMPPSAATASRFAGWSRAREEAAVAASVAPTGSVAPDRRLTTCTNAE